MITQFDALTHTTGPENAGGVKNSHAAAEVHAQPQEACPVEEPTQPLDDQCGPATPVKTLAEVKEAYADHASNHRLRGQYRSACNSMGGVLGRPLDQIPIDAAALKPMLAAAIPGNAGISGERWRKVQSQVRCAIRDLGLKIVMSRDNTPMTAVWRVLYGDPKEAGPKTQLSRLLRYCGRQGITPETFTLAVFEGFRAELVSSSLEGDPDAICRQVARAWNHMILSDSRWPQVCLPVAKGRYAFSLDWGSFPVSLVEDIEAFLASGSSTDPTDSNYGRPARPETLKSRRDRLRIWASALVLSGVRRLEELASLETLVEVENFKAALAYLRDRKGKLTAYHCGYVALAKTIARHWVRDEVLVRKLTAIEMKARNAVGAQKGMTAKNRERLRQFDIDTNIDLLYALPFKVLREVSKNPVPSRKDAVRLMYAFEVAILSYTPIRLKNLTELELGKSVIDYGHGRRRMVHIYLAAQEVKNGREYEGCLPDTVLKLLDAWLEIYRPLICRAPNPYLFPSPAGKLRSKIALSHHLKKFIEKETGLVMHAHLFRHLMAKLYLEQHPQDVETVRQALNHTSTQTTMNAYMELRAAPALKRHWASLATRPAKASLAKAKAPVAKKKRQEEPA